jgi:protein TonB
MQARPGERLVVEARLVPLVASPGPASPPGAPTVAATLHASEPRPTPIPIRQGDFVELRQVDMKPVRMAGDWAGYPDAAVRKRQTGTVEVEMVVTESGQPTDLQIIGSAGQVLDDAVLKAMRKWRFEPARKNGVRVRTLMRFKQTFQ